MKPHFAGQIGPASRYNKEEIDTGVVKKHLPSCDVSAASLGRLTLYMSISVTVGRETTKVYIGYVITVINIYFSR